MRFTIRELILVTVVAALGVAFAVDHVQIDRERHEYRQIKEEHALLVEFITERYVSVRKMKWGWEAIEKDYPPQPATDNRP